MMSACVIQATELQLDLQARHGRWLLKLLAALFSYAHELLPASSATLHETATSPSTPLQDAIRILSLFGVAAPSSYLPPPSRAASSTARSPQKITEAMALLLSKLWSVETLETLCTLPFPDPPIMRLLSNQHNLPIFGAQEPILRTHHHDVKRAVHMLWRRCSSWMVHTTVVLPPSAVMADALNMVALALHQKYFSRHPAVSPSRRFLSSASEDATKSPGDHQQQSTETTNNTTSQPLLSVFDLWNDNDAEVLIHWYQHSVKFARQKPKASTTPIESMMYNERDGWVSLADVFQAWKPPSNSRRLPEWIRELHTSSSTKQHALLTMLSRSLWELDLCVRLQWPCEPPSDDLLPLPSYLMYVRATYMHKDAAVADAVMTSHKRIETTLFYGGHADNSSQENDKPARWLDWSQLSQEGAIKEFTKHKGRYLPPFRPYLLCVSEASFDPLRTSEASRSSSMSRAATLEVLNLKSGVVLPELNPQALERLVKASTSTTMRCMARSTHPHQSSTDATGDKNSSASVIMISFECCDVEPSFGVDTSSSWTVTSPHGGGGFVVATHDRPTGQQLYTGWGLEARQSTTGVDGNADGQLHLAPVVGIFADLPHANAPVTSSQPLQATTSASITRQHDPNIHAIEEDCQLWRQRCDTQIQLVTDFTRKEQCSWNAMKTYRLFVANVDDKRSAKADVERRVIINKINVMLKNICAKQPTVGNSSSSAHTPSKQTSLYMLERTAMNHTTSASRLTDIAANVELVDFVVDLAPSHDVHVVVCRQLTTTATCPSASETADRSHFGLQLAAEWVLAAVPSIHWIVESQFVMPCYEAMKPRIPVATTIQPAELAARLRLRLEEALDLTRKDPLEFVGDAVVDYLFVMKYLYGPNHSDSGGGGGPDDEGGRSLSSGATATTTTRTKKDASSLGAFMTAHTSNLFLGSPKVLGWDVRLHLALRWGLPVRSSATCDAMPDSKAFGDVTEAITGALFLHALVDWNLPITDALEVVRDVLGIDRCVVSL